MRNKLILSGILLLFAVLIYACMPANDTSETVAAEKKENIKGIQFMEANWSKALEAAKAEKKLIFLDAYASWCGPCKLLKRNTFTNKEAGDFFNKNFINIAMDMEKGDGPALAEKFNVTAYPTLIFADANGNIVTYTTGYINPKQLIDFGKHGLVKQKNK